MVTPLNLYAAIPAPESVMLFIDSTFLYTNPFDAVAAGQMPAFTRITEQLTKDYTWQAQVLIPAENVLAVTDKAYTNHNVGTAARPTTRPIELKGNLMDYADNIGVEDLAEACNRPAPTSSFGFLTEALQVFDRSVVAQAVLATRIISIRNSLAKVIWYSQSANYANNTGGTAAPFYRNIPNATALQALKEMLNYNSRSNKTMEDGFWAQAVALQLAGQVPFVSTNNGTAQTNATRETVVEGLFDQMISELDPKWQGIADNDPEKPFFLVDRAIFQACWKLLSAYNDTESGRSLYQQLPSMLVYNGYQVFPDYAAHNYDNETGAVVTSTIDGRPVKHSRNLRAILMKPGNYMIGADLANQSVGGMSTGPIGLLIAQGTVPNVNLGTVSVKALAVVGGTFADPSAMVIGYATSQTFV